VKRLIGVLRGIGARSRALLAEPVWGSLAAKMGLGVALFLALAAVGSGAALGLLPANRQAPAAALASSVPSAAPSAESPVIPTPTDAGVAEPESAPPAAVLPDGRVILNLATEEDLRRLPGIGAVRAKRILELRQKLGGKFKRPEDLLRVKGIGRRSFARLRPLLLVDSPRS